jgi:hypothetical protein
MWPRSKLYLDSLGTWRDVRYAATHYDPFTGASTPLTITGGEVQVDSGASCRRELRMTVPPLAEYVDALGAPGGEITVAQTVRYIDHTEETVPLGVFVVDEDSHDYDDDGQLRLTCRDRSVIVQRNKLGRPGDPTSSVAANPAWMEIKRLVEGAWPNAAYPFPGWAQLDSSAVTPAGPLMWADGDRDAAIRKIAVASSVQAYFAPDGRAVLRRVPAPQPGAAPVWTVRPREGGALLGAERTRDRSKLFNAVIVDSTAAGLYLPRVIASNTDQNDPYSIHGPLGFQPKQITSPAFYSPNQMQVAAIVKLSKLLGAASELTVTCVPNAALDADDVIGVVTPGGDPAKPEIRVASSFTVPLLPTGVQRIQCRSILPTGYEDLLTELGFTA